MAEERLGVSCEVSSLGGINSNRVRESKGRRRRCETGLAAESSVAKSFLDIF